MSNKFNRNIRLKECFEAGSAFLLGPRQVGKSSLLKEPFPQSTLINLLKSEEYLSLSNDPSRQRTIAQPTQITVIDEIQRIPELLNEIHYLIEERGARFLMTGSSARKLRRGGVNLLGGRARTFRLHPLSIRELGSHFSLDFESLVYQELRCFSDYVSNEEISYWRTTTNLEVDFILGERLAVEAKAARVVADSDLRGLRALAQEGPFKARVVVCQEPHVRLTDDRILILPLAEFVTRLWEGEW